jgi:hypothetical protein
MDFSNTLIRASAFSKIMTEPKEKAAKDAGQLSQTAKTYLKELYIEQLWGLSRDLQNKYCDKGKMVEPEMVTMLCRLDKQLYEKNEERIDSEYFTGIPDIFRGENIRKADYLIDGKSSWSPWTFIAKMGEKLDKEYWTQMQIYFDLCNCDAGEISFCLISTPETIIMDEKRRLFYSMNAGTEENADYLSACEELELSSRFDHIPLAHRRIKFPVERDNDFIELAKQKVRKCREYLKELHETHMKL